MLCIQGILYIPVMHYYPVGGRVMKYVSGRFLGVRECEVEAPVLRVVDERPHPLGFATPIKEFVICVPKGSRVYKRVVERTLVRGYTERYVITTREGKRYVFLVRHEIVYYFRLPAVLHIESAWAVAP